MLFSEHFRPFHTLKPQDPSSGIESFEALRRTHAITVAMLEETSRHLHETEQELKRQARRIRTLESLAVTDEMTGLMNRRGFECDVKKELERIRRGKSCGGAFALFDLDRFKPINDTYGHFAGDLCLKAVGECLEDMIRTTDMAARLGGDEFAVFLAGIDEKQARAKLAEINTALNSLVIPWDDDDLAIGASLGFTMVKSDAPDYDDIYMTADRAMYCIKSMTQGKGSRTDRLLNATTYP